MNRDDLRGLSDDGLADHWILVQRVEAMTKTIQEQQDTIKLLQDEHRSLRVGDVVDKVELRRQLAESEQMRALMCDELQRFRTQVDQMVILAAGAIREELHAMEELSELGYLNITGHARLDELRDWLAKYENR